MQRSNTPVMTGTKACIRCREVRRVTDFHVHRQMRDGRLNKCAPCVRAAVDEWRLKNPSARKQEHARSAQRHGIANRSQYLADVAARAIGRKASALKYFHKRRGRVTREALELDDLALVEARQLCELRERATGLKWSIDHIVPIHHRTVSGLHVAANLNVAPSVWNSQKGNRFVGRYLGD